MGDNAKLGRKTNLNNHIDYIKVDNNKITNKTVMANVMNDYFCEVDEKLSEKINVTDFTLPRQNMTCKSLFLKPTKHMILLSYLPATLWKKLRPIWTIILQ